VAAQTARGRNFQFTASSSAGPVFRPVIKISQEEKPFRLTISSDLIDFGPLSPTNPIKRSINISFATDKRIGATLFTFANHPLKAGNNTIPDVSCDDGSCTESHATEWLNPLTFGLGYSKDDTHFQKFPDASTKKQWATIKEGDMTIKLNINKTQPEANYINLISIVAIPKL
jgi:hypothetical protein